MAYRYLGNKARIVDEIVAAVGQVAGPGATVADPMCGTATVSSGLAASGFHVHASDELTFPVVHARVRLLVDEIPHFEALGGYRAALDDLNSTPPVQGFFFHEYSPDGEPRNGSRPRRYFTAENASRIDAVRLKLASWREAGMLMGRESDLLVHDLIMAVNRVANIAGTYGYFRSTWNRASLQPLELRPTEVEATGAGHRVEQGRVEDTVAELDADVLYLDPPYTKRQYAGNYHILETLAVGDEFDPVGEGGLRDWYGQYSDFCSKRAVRDALRTVLDRARVRWILMSYSEDGLIPPEELRGLLGEYGEVQRHDLVLPRFRSNGGRSEAVKEHLYCIDAA